MPAVKQIMSKVAVSLGALLVAFAVWFAKPWDDLQSWRWYTLPFEGLRGELFTHWEVIQPQSQLLASTTPRVYRRVLHRRDDFDQNARRLMKRCQVLSGHAVAA